MYWIKLVYWYEKSYYENLFTIIAEGALGIVLFKD